MEGQMASADANGKRPLQMENAAAAGKTEDEMED
jgi:hypothetical protein